jgi:hypothetical protein
VIIFGIEYTTLQKNLKDVADSHKNSEGFICTGNWRSDNAVVSHLGANEKAEMQICPYY